MVVLLEQDELKQTQRLLIQRKQALKCMASFTEFWADTTGYILVSLPCHNCREHGFCYGIICYIERGLNRRR